MPAGNIRQSGGGDLPPPLPVPPDHSDILRRVTDLTDRPSPILTIFERAVQEAKEASSDIAQQEAVGRELLERAQTGIQNVVERLKEAENEALQHREAEREIREEAKLSGQSTPDFSRQLAQIRRAYHEANDKIQIGVSNLNLALNHLGRAITKAFQGLPEALPATKYIWRPRELLDATLVVAQEDLQTLRKQLSTTGSPTDSHTQIADLPLGHIPLKEALESGIVDKLGATIKLFRRMEQEPVDPDERPRLDLRRDILLDAFKDQEGAYHPWIKGSTVLDKLSNLYSQLHEYWDRPTGYTPSSFRAELLLEHLTPILDMDDVEARVKDVEVALFGDQQKLDELRRPL
jgi:hypothetical protein